MTQESPNDERLLDAFRELKEKDAASTQTFASFRQRRRRPMKRRLQVASVFAAALVASIAFVVLRPRTAEPPQEFERMNVANLDTLAFLRVRPALPTTPRGLK